MAGSLNSMLSPGSIPGQPPVNNMLANSPYPAMNQPISSPVVPYSLPKGMVLAGNINDPQISRDGLQSFEFVHNGVHLETLLPTVVGGRRLTPAQAIERYKQTGQHFGKFDTPDSATAFARQMNGR